MLDKERIKRRACTERHRQAGTDGEKEKEKKIEAVIVREIVQEEDKSRGW